MKLIKNSNVARQLFFKVTGVALVSFSNIKWWSKYDVLEQMLWCFGFLLPWLTQCIEGGFAVEPAARLIGLLAEPSSMHYLKIELSAYCFVGQSLRLITYFLEGDGQLSFVTHEVLRKYFFDAFPGGEIPEMQEVRALAAKALSWATSVEGVAELAVLKAEVVVAEASAAAGPVVAAVRARRSTANANAGQLSVAQRAAANARAAAAKAVKQAALDAAVVEKRRRLALKLASLPPQNVDAWESYAKDQVLGVVEYFGEAMGGRHARSRKLFEACSIFVPATLVALSPEEAEARIKLYITHPKFDAATVASLVKELPDLTVYAKEYVTSHRVLLPGEACRVRLLSPSGEVRFAHCVDACIVRFDMGIGYLVAYDGVDKSVVEVRVPEKFVEPAE